jgi:hypothetical protein
LKRNVQQALDCIHHYGGIDGAHHKQWLLDRVVLILSGSGAKYDEWVAEFQDGDDGPQTYTWDRGVAP